MAEIVVIGGGIAGCAAALKLADAGHQVTLLEGRDELLAGSSDDTPCRLGLGFHYLDFDTACKYLRASIRVVRTFRGEINLRLGEEKELNDPLRRGRYFVVPTKINLFNTIKILEFYEQLKDEYARLVGEDPKNEVFGPPAEFYKELAVDEYKDDVNTQKVFAGIETAEHVLNWPDFREYYSKLVEQHDNITVRTGIEVDKIEYDNQCSAHKVIAKTKTGDDCEFLGTDIVNSSWQNIEAIEQKSGSYVAPKPRTNRVKVIISVNLPEGFENKNSMFFCFGAHCSFTNVGNNIGWITYEPVTNVATSTGLVLPEELQRLVAGNASEKEKLEYGRRILDGVASYIPAFAAVQDKDIVSTKFGVVRTEGTSADINSPESKIHKRDKLGVTSNANGRIQNPAMKLLYFLENADVVNALITQHEVARELATRITEQVLPNLDGDRHLKAAVKSNVIEALSAFPNPNNDTELQNMALPNSLDNTGKDLLATLDNAAEPVLMTFEKATDTVRGTVENKLQFLGLFASRVQNCDRDEVITPSAIKRAALAT